MSMHVLVMAVSVVWFVSALDELAAVSPVSIVATRRVNRTQSFTCQAQARTSAAGTATNFRIQIKRYVADVDRKAMTDALTHGGYPGFVTALRQAPAIGQIELGGKSFSIRWAREQKQARAVASRLSLTPRCTSLAVGRSMPSRGRDMNWPWCRSRSMRWEWVRDDGGAAKVKPDGQGGVVLEDYADEPYQTDVREERDLMTPAARTPWVLCGLLLAVAPVWADAQSRKRGRQSCAGPATKAAQITRYAPGTAERIARSLKRRLFETPNGFYPWFGSVYSGGGFTVGGGYRQYYGDQSSWSARGLFSAKSYKLAELVTDGIGLGRGRINLQAIGGWRDATQVAFYGVGGDTAPEAKSNFRMKQAYAGVSAHARGPGALAFDVGFRVDDFTLEPGHGSSPSIEELHNADTAPGLGVDPIYLHMTLSGGLDSRPSADYARRGGLYALTYDVFSDQDDGVYSFDALQAEIVQHVPILRENWVFSVHGLARTTLDDTSAVPFFLMPSLGSGSTLRAFPSWRFRDRHSILVSGEWRWIPNASFLDMAIFYDAGKVVSRRADLNFEGLTHDWGVGVRFHGPVTTPLRIDSRSRARRVRSRVLGRCRLLSAASVFSTVRASRVAPYGEARPRAETA